MMFDELIAQKAALFVDQEMSLAEAEDYLAVIERQEEARRTVGRYYLIGEVLRTGGVPRCSGLADRVAQQLASEPTILAPVSKGKSSERFRRHLMTGALAASLALMAIIVWRGVSGVAAFDGRFGDAAVANAHIDPEMQAYLLEHSGTSHVVGAGTLMPYMRLVSYEQ